MRCARPLVLIVALAAAAPLAAQQPAAEALAVGDLLELEQVADPQLSPDGRRIVYTRRWVDRVADRWASSIWIMDVDGSRNRFLVDGSRPRWSPDGRRIAYLADTETTGIQLFVRWLDAAEATQITRTGAAPSSHEWSPDGRFVAFVMRTPPEKEWKIDLPPPPKGATWTEPPRVVDGVYFRQDRRGFMEDGFHHLFVVDAEGGTPRQLTRGSWHVGARTYGIDAGATLSWTPDGRTVVFDGLAAEDGAERPFRRSHVYAVDVASGHRRRLTQGDGPWLGPRVSPDGRLVAFTGHPWTVQAYRAAELYVVGIDGAGMRSLTPELDREPAQLHWRADGSALAFTAEDRGAAELFTVDLRGRVRRVTEGAHVLSLGSMAGAVAAAVESTPHRPGDVVTVRLPDGATTRLTRVNDDVLAGRRLGEVEELWYPSADGTRIQGWLVKPPGFDPGRRYPLILHIHGGPHSMYDVGFSYSFQHLAAAGYLVLFSNPRGSSGYGTDFGNAIDNDYPSVDADDLMAGVDAVLGRGIADPRRLYVTGISGGGVLSAWLTSRTDRFAAAAVRAPVINWISFAGTTDITDWGYLRFRPQPWQDPSVWLAHSPLMHVHKVTTPTLLMCGELDLRTPMGQTEEYFQALNAVGVETRLVRFNGEYHGTASKPSNAMRTQLYLLSWFADHVRGVPTARSQ